ncbi:hypothetical protein CVW53_25365 [Salmonella enterica]|nr:hypothetical protein [Salmonella enterica]
MIASARNISRVIYESKQNNVKYIKPLFWLLHPSELYAGYCLGSTFLKRLSYKLLYRYIKLLPAIKVYMSIINKLDLNNNIWIMDRSCQLESEWALNYKFREKVILPLITNLDYQPVKNIEQERYTILIISRLDDFKIHGIVKLLDDIIQYTKKNKSCKISVHIVGDGIAGKFLKENYVNSINMDVFFHGYVSGKKLTELFHNGNYSLLFAMGTSALEGASRGLPTVLLPCTDKSIRNRDNVYRYLHIDNDQGLGEYIDTPFEGTEYLTFNEIVEIFNRDKENLVCNTRKYFLNNYGKEITQKNFLLSLEKVKILSINEVKISLTFRIYTKFILKKRLSTGV